MRNPKIIKERKWWVSCFFESVIKRMIKYRSLMVSLGYWKIEGIMFSQQFGQTENKGKCEPGLEVWKYAK